MSREVDTWVNAFGHTMVTLFDNEGRPQDRPVAELVLEAFVGPCPPGASVQHLDGDPQNNQLSNLRWL